MNTDMQRIWRILLVDDNQLDLADAKAALLRGSQRRYWFAEAGLVSEALAMCAGTDDLDAFDCMVLDFELPDGDALDVLARLPRGEGGVAHLPVVILTGASTHSGLRAGLRAGAQDYVGKAWLGPESLTWAVENAIERHKIAREVSAARREIEVQRQDLLEAERAARSESERLALIKDEFLANLSHELRTPLSAIVGWASVLQREPTSAEVTRRGIDAIARNGALQASLIDDLLDMNRIVSGKLKMDAGPVDINALVAAATDMLSPAARIKGVAITLALGPVLPAHAWGDAMRLQQVFANLINNALKFTKAGGDIVIATQVLDGGAVEVTVRDTGIGIDARFLPFLFDRFTQANGATTRAHGGLGLGLSIVKHLVELHGGVAAGSSPGVDQGSTFTVVLPPAPQSGGLTRAHAAQTRLEPAQPGHHQGDYVSGADLRGIDVLLVDDHEDVLELSRRVLTECGARVVTTGSAALALEYLRHNRPHVLVSDISMPDMNGYDLIGAIRNRLGLDARELPAMAISAFTRPQDRQRALDAGFQAYIVKPIEPHLLAQTVRSLACARVDAAVAASACLPDAAALAALAAGVVTPG